MPVNWTISKLDEIWMISLFLNRDEFVYWDDIIYVDV